MTCPECQKDMTEFAEFSVRTNSIEVTALCTEPGCGKSAFQGLLMPVDPQVARETVFGG